MEDIRKELMPLRDEEYAIFNKKLCPDTDKEMLGIRIPQLRKLAKNLVKDYHWKECLAYLKEEYFEEIVLQGLVIGYAKATMEEKLPFIQNFVSKIDSWAICDTFVPTLKIKLEDLEMFWNFILPFTKSNKEFEVRFSIICMLDYFLIEDYVDKVIQELDKIQHDGYYVKMGIAWTLAEIGIKFNHKVMQYLTNDNHLDKFTYNKTLQKMRESYRISSNQKEILNNMKRK